MKSADQLPLRPEPEEGNSAGRVTVTIKLSELWDLRNKLYAQGCRVLAVSAPFDFQTRLSIEKRVTVVYQGTLVEGGEASDESTVHS